MRAAVLLSSIALVTTVACSKNDTKSVDTTGSIDPATQAMVHQHDCEALRAVLDPAQQKFAAIAHEAYDAKHYEALAKAREETVAALKQLSLGDPDVSKIADDYRTLNERTAATEHEMAASLGAAAKGDAGKGFDAEAFTDLVDDESSILDRFDKACARVVLE